MMSINQVTLMGNLGRDPEVRSFGNGGRVCNLRVATSDVWNDKASGERKERTEWHSVAIFDEKLVALAERYLRKGSQVHLVGKLETRKWQDQNGQDRYATEVVLRPFKGELRMLDRPTGDKSDGDQYAPGSQASGGYGGIADDEIPF